MTPGSSKYAGPTGDAYFCYVVGKNSSGTRQRWKEFVTNGTNT